MISAKLLVPAGAPDHAKGGDILLPSPVNSIGKTPSWPTTGLRRLNPVGALAGSAASARFDSAPRPPPPPPPPPPLRRL